MSAQAECLGAGNIGGAVISDHDQRCGRLAQDFAAFQEKVSARFSDYLNLRISQRYAGADRGQQGPGFRSQPAIAAGMGHVRIGDNEPCAACERVDRFLEALIGKPRIAQEGNDVRRFAFDTEAETPREQPHPGIGEHPCAG